MTSPDPGPGARRSDDAQTADDSEEWIGRWLGAVRRWWCTFFLLFYDRRALLSTAPPDADRRLPPVAFMLSGAGSAYLLSNLIGWKAPPSELSPGAATLVRATDAFGNPVTLVAVVAALIDVGIFWVVFRVAGPRLPLRIVLRHAAYNVGGQMPCLALYFVPLLIWRATGHPPATWLGLAADYGANILYLWLLVIAMRQLADESGRRVRRVFLPFMISVAPALALSQLLGAVQPDTWLIRAWLSRVTLMEPAIHPDDPVHVNTWVLQSRELEPGDVVQIAPATSDRVPSAMAHGTPWLARVIATPGDEVEQSGADFRINGSIVPRDRTRLRAQPTDSRTPIAFRERLGERSFVVQLGPAQTPGSCLASRGRTLPEKTYVLAYDTRPDGQVFCGLFPRDQIIGIADWNARSRARP